VNSLLGVKFSKTIIFVLSPLIISYCINSSDKYTWYLYYNGVSVSVNPFN
jgi:hypothetical protein